MSDLEPQPGAEWAGPPPIEPPPAVAVAVEDRPPRYPFWTWGDLAVFIGLMVPCFVAASLITNVVLMAAGAHDIKPAYRAVPAQFIGYALAFLALWLMFRTRYGQPFWKSLSWRMDRSMAFPMIAGGMALAFAVAMAAAVLRTRPVKSPMEELMRDPSVALMLAVFAVTLGPVCEELIFRGFMQPLMVRALGAAAGIVITAIPFAVLHGPQYANRETGVWSWQHVVLIALAGSAFGLVRHRTGSTALAAVMHAGYNATFFAVFFLFQSGL